MSYEALVQNALAFKLGAEASHEAVVDLLYGNLTGSLPSDAQAQPYVDLLASGSATPASLAGWAAAMPRNEANIDLVGLASHGLSFA